MMKPEHKDLAAGRWKTLTFFEQMANIAGEVERASNWKIKAKPDYSEKAFARALELVDLTLDSTTTKTHLRELTRMREALVDFFAGSNQSGSTDASWKKYFLPFVYAARRNS